MADFGTDFGTAFGGFAEGLAGGFTAGTANRVKQQSLVASAEQQRKKRADDLFEQARKAVDQSNPLLADKLITEAFGLDPKRFSAGSPEETKASQKTIRDLFIKTPEDQRNNFFSLKDKNPGMTLGDVAALAIKSGTPAGMVSNIVDTLSKADQFGATQAGRRTQADIGRVLQAPEPVQPDLTGSEGQKLSDRERILNRFGGLIGDLRGRIQAIKNTPIRTQDPNAIKARQDTIAGLNAQIASLETQQKNALARFTPSVVQQFTGAEGNVRVLQGLSGEAPQLRELGKISRATKVDAQLALAQAITDVRSGQALSAGATRNPLVQTITKVQGFESLKPAEKIKKFEEARKLISSVGEDAFIALLRFFGVDPSKTAEGESPSDKAARAAARVTR